MSSSKTGVEELKSQVERSREGGGAEFAYLAA